ncbi:MAG TPA: TonB-dependent receptor [Candidatus Dormibacteraeota bacterium]|nr:TonB-dependent receptor [Candidatus Dormibacteraeota bacterium]
MSRLCAAALVAVCLLTCGANAFAATTSLIRGVVTLAGKPQAGATVTLTGDGSSFTTTTGPSGVYHFSRVPFGHYHLTVRENGSDNPTLDIDITSDSVATVNVPLDRLAIIGRAVVAAHAGASGTPVSVNVISKQQIANSPNRDNLNRLIETVPGIVRFSYNEPVAHGFHGVTYEIDGAPLPLATSSNFGEIIDPRNIDSLEISTGAMPAEYGGSRAGAVINIVTTRLSDVAPGSYGHVSIGGGSFGSASGSLSDLIRFKNSELFVSTNAQRSNPGIDAPTYSPIHDGSSNADQFVRFLTQLSPRSTLSFDASNQLGQFQIPINTDPNNPIDPVFSPAGTDDVQREYDRFFNVNFTTTSKDGDGIFQVIPWVRYTRIAYAGNLASDVQTLAPNSAYGDPTSPSAPLYANQIGLRQDRRASYGGIRISDFRATKHHAFKVGLDASREIFNASQTFGCYDPACTLAPTTPLPPPPAPGYYAFTTGQHQAGAQIGIYAQDQWQPNRNLAVNYGLRYDHSTGYAGGYMLEPRIGINLSDGGKNIAHVYYGRFYAAPQLEDVRADCVLLNGCSGTPTYNLQPERDAYYELGVAHYFNAHMKGYVNIFQRSVTNVLDTTQFLNTPLFAVFNNATGIDTGFEVRLQDALHDGDSWYVSGTVSGSYAGGISGSTFLFPTSSLDTGGLPLTSPALLAPEDHDQTVAVTAAYTHTFGPMRSWFGTLQTNYGTGYPVAFQNLNGGVLNGRLASHTTFDLSLGRHSAPRIFGFDFDVQNLLNHQYVIKIANGFNTTQIASGRRVDFRITSAL